MQIIIYTDGASRGNPGPGGWGVYVEVQKEKLYTTKLSGREENTTNNRMELTANIEALKYLKKNLPQILKNKDLKIILKMDSQYVRKGITLWIKNWQKNNWRGANKKLILNQELWQELLSLKNFINDKLIKDNFREIEFAYVKGHSGIYGNELADDLATKAADTLS